MEQGSKRWNEGAAPRTGSRRTHLFAGAGLGAALCAAALFAGQFTDAADGKKKKKKFNFVGKYQGTTEDPGGTVSFRLTREGKIVGFTLTNVQLGCRTQPNPVVEYTKTVTITHGPMPMKEKSKKFPQGKKFEFHDPLVPFDSAGAGGDFTGKLVNLLPTGPTSVVKPGKRFVGEVAYVIANGPNPPAPAVWAPGTEQCDTAVQGRQRLLDWEATTPGNGVVR